MPEWIVKFLSVIANLRNSLDELPWKRVLLLLIIVLGYLIFLPKEFEHLPGLNMLREKYSDYIGIAFIVILLWFLMATVSSVLHYNIERSQYRGRDAKRRLNKLNQWAKAFVRQLYETPSHSQKVPLQNANIKLLLDMSVLMHANLGDAIGFECVLQPWVTSFLNENPDFVEQMPKFNKPYHATLAIWDDEDEGGTF